MSAVPAAKSTSAPPPSSERPVHGQADDGRARKREALERFVEANPAVLAELAK